MFTYWLLRFLCFYATTGLITFVYSSHISAHHVMVDRPILFCPERYFLLPVVHTVHDVVQFSSNYIRYAVYEDTRSRIVQRALTQRATTIAPHLLHAHSDLLNNCSCLTSQNNDMITRNAGGLRKCSIIWCSLTSTRDSSTSPPSKCGRNSMQNGKAS